jgi:tRNA modification GTPase
MDTIFALATAQGKAGVSIVRVSGEKAFQTVEIVSGKPARIDKPSLRYLFDSKSNLIDQALVLCFEKGASFTGEQVVEFQTHGSPAIVNALVKRLSDVGGCRLADPGEFTRRALLNGNLDLAQVEGLADLIEAETEAQRLQAIRVFDGKLGELAFGWRKSLIRAAALLEATIDFVDEEVPVDVSPEVVELLLKVSKELELEEAGADTSERIRDGFEVAIIGPPNIGKSTLLNRLAGREAALTSTIAGTTRDVIEVRLDLKGLPVTILDTAGIRETDDVVETLGIDLATRRANQADMRIFLCESEADEWPVDHVSEDIKVLGKIDSSKEEIVGVSGLTGVGVSDLIDRIADVLSIRAGNGSHLIRERHRVAISEAILSLKMAQNRLDAYELNTEIIAEDIRVAVRALDSLIGTVGVENILDEVFSSFCLGK